MRCYLSFSDEVFEGVTPLEEMSAGPGKKAGPHSMVTMPAVAPGVEATPKAAGESAAVRKFPKFPSWEKVLHPSWPVVAAGQISHPSGSLGWRFHNWEMMTAPPETPSPTQELEVVWAGDMLIPCFLGVVACLRSQSVEGVYEASLDPLAVGVMSASGVATMCTSCIIRDEVTGATYLDTVSHLGWESGLSVALNRTLQPRGPMIEDVMDLIWRVARYLRHRAVGWPNYNCWADQPSITCLWVDKPAKDCQRAEEPVMP